MIDRWNAWIAAFDAACADDDWTRLEPFLTDDVIYVVAGAPFACEVRGRDEVIAAFARSIRNFDRKLDERKWFGVGIKEWPPEMETTAVTGRAMGCYRLGDRPPITFSARSQWIFRGDRLSVMTDVYDITEADVIATLVTLAEIAESGERQLDASYVAPAPAPGG
jgi:hypothetical protein